MSAVYYEVVGGEVLAFCRDFRERRARIRKGGLAWAESKGAEAFMEAWGSVWGLIFPRDEAPEGWKASPKRSSSGRVIFTPHKRTAPGKVLAAELKALPVEPSPDEFAKQFDIPRSLRYQNADVRGSMMLTAIFPHTSFIAWINEGDGFWVVLPDINGEIEDRATEGYACDPASWTVPEGIKRSSRARYDLAVAQEAVASEVAA